MHEYLFDVKLFASIRVKAKNEALARGILANEIDDCTLMVQEARFRAIEISVDGEADLAEVDGQDVP